MSFIPPYPRPSKGWLVLHLMRAWNSWLNAMVDVCYTMKIGRVRLPGFNITILNDPALVEQVLVKQPRKFPKHRTVHKLLSPLIGETPFSTNGEIWQQQRRLLDQGFDLIRLRQIYPLMHGAVTDMLARLNQVADGKPYRMDKEMTHVTADIIFRTILTSRLSDQAADEIIDALTKYQHHAHHVMMLERFHLPSWFARRSAKRCARDLRQPLGALIRERYDARERGEKSPSEDILAGLMAAVDPVDGRSFSYAEMVDQVCMLVMAGHETSASALTWALYLLSHSPDLQKELLAEIESVAGGRELEFSDLKKLRQTWNVFRETLRLYPPVGLLLREPVETQCMRNQQVDAGSEIWIAPWLIQRHRSYWEGADEFCPARFDTEAGRESARQAYLPFGMGERVCIGAAFATQESILILASLVRCYEILPVTEHVPKCAARITIRSDNGIQVRLQTRNVN